MKAKNQELIYNPLLRAWQNEHKRIKINPIPNKESFLEDLRELIQTIKSTIEKEKKSAIRNIYEKNIDIIQYMVSDLLDLREEKILKNSRNLTKIDEDILLAIEIPYYRQLLTAFKGYSKGKKMLVGGILRNGSLYKQSTSSVSSPSSHQTNQDPTIASRNDALTKPIISSNIQNVSESDIPQVNENHRIKPAVDNEKSTPLTYKKEKIGKTKNTSQPKIEPKTKIKSKALNSNSLQIENFEYMTVRINHPLQPIVGADMKIYGPLDPGSIVYLPKPNAEILIEEDIAIPIQKE